MKMLVALLPFQRKKKKRLYRIKEDGKNEDEQDGLEEEERRGGGRFSTVGTICLTTSFSHACRCCYEFQ